MRDLTLLETGFLAGGLVLCLVLPLLMSVRGPLGGAARESCMRIVWTGQAILTGACLAVLASSPVAPYAAALGLMGYTGCVGMLLRRLRSADMA